MTDNKPTFKETFGHDVITFNVKKSKLTPQKEIDIALRILEKQDMHDLETIFVPICNAMIAEKLKNYEENKKKPQDEFPIGLPFPPPESS